MIYFARIFENEKSSDYPNFTVFDFFDHKQIPYLIPIPPYLVYINLLAKVLNIGSMMV
jgi:hypothetical protein